MAPPDTDGVARMVIVAIDGNESRVQTVQGPRTLSGAELGLRWAHDVHFGQGLGIFWRLLTIGTGLALPVFAITGIAMWLSSSWTASLAISGSVRVDVSLT